MNNNDFSIPIDSPFNAYKKLNSKEKYPSILSDRSLKNKIQENLFCKTKSSENNSVSNSNKKLTNNNNNNNNNNDSSKNLKFNSSNNIHILKNENLNESRNNQNSLFKSLEQKDLMSSSYFKNIGNNLMNSSNSLSKDSSNTNNIYFTKEINMNFNNNNIINKNNNDYFVQSNNNKNNLFKKGGIFLNNRYNSNNEIPLLKFESKENSNKISFTPIIVKGKKRMNTNNDNNNYNDNNYELFENGHQKNSLSHFFINSENKNNYYELNNINNDIFDNKDDVFILRHRSLEKSLKSKISLENDNYKNNKYNYNSFNQNTPRSSNFTRSRNNNDFDINQFNSENSTNNNNFYTNNNEDNDDNFDNEDNKINEMNLITNIKSIDANNIKIIRKKSNFFYKINKEKTNLIHNKNDNNNILLKNNSNEENNQTLKEKYNNFINNFNRNVAKSEQKKTKKNYIYNSNNQNNNNNIIISNYLNTSNSNSKLKLKNNNNINVINTNNYNNPNSNINDNNNNNNSNHNNNHNSNHNNNYHNNNKNFIKKTYSLSQAGYNEDRKPKINQDSFFELNHINNFENFNIFCVLDGHGSNGHLISQYVKKSLKTDIIKSNEFSNCESYNEIYEKIAKNNYRLIKVILKNIEKNLNYESEIDNSFSGTTCILVINICDKLIVFNIGDSRAIMICENKKIISLSKDHKPLDENEKKRIELKGGEIHQLKDGDEFYGPYRVWVKGEKYPGIAMSRSIGDAVATEIGVVSVPDIKEFNIDNNSKYVIIASDGLYEFLSNEKIAHYANKFYRKNDVEKCCKYLIKKASEKWEIEEDVRDDITVICIFF